MCLIKYSRESLLENRSLNMTESSILDNTPIKLLQLEKTVSNSNSRTRSRGNCIKTTLLTLLLWNIEGLKSVISNAPNTNLLQNLNNQDVDIALLTETFCVQDPPPFDGYYCFSQPAECHEDRRGRPIGGISIYAKPSLKPQLTHMNNNRVHISTSIGHIFCYYYNPLTSIDNIIEELTEDLDNISEQCIVTGDFNCRIDNSSDKGNLIQEFMSSQGFQLLTDSNQYT